jgi:hypothetical protein
MTRLAALFFVIIGFAKPLFAQSVDREPVLSKASLTSEQVAVYRAFLRFYAKGSDRVLYVADTTDWLDVSDVKEEADCSRSFGQIEFDVPKGSGPTIHRLESSLAIAGHIALVDSASQSAKIRQSDPSKTMREGKSVDRAVSDAFASALLTLSEIAFDKEHNKAVMSFSFFCGKLCGNGAVVMLKRVGRNWKVTKRSCGESVS